MADHTLTYSKGVQGWPSFYSFVPDWMTAINNRFYSFKGGNLYLHNSSDANRCNFYGTDNDTTITTVINESPLENKLFKTVELQGTDGWDADITTDIQSNGYVEKGWFDKKEQVWFAFIRNSGTVPISAEQLNNRTFNGIAKSTSVTGISGARIANFPLTVNIGSGLSVGDYLCYSVSPYTSVVLTGKVTDIEIDKPNGINRITFDDTIGGAVTPPDADDFYSFFKDMEAESQGVLGHYAIVQLTNSQTDATELFSVGSEVMKSFP